MKARTKTVTHTGRSILWVHTSKDAVEILDGPEMPKEPASGFYVSLWGNRTIARKEFARWSGLTFPKGEGYYGLRLSLGIIERWRVVEEKEFVAAKHTTRKFVKVDSV